MNFLKTIVIAFISLSFACSKDLDSPEVSFYYWKTIFKLNQTEKSILKANEVKSLYIRYFDVDINKIDSKPYPVSAVKFEQKPDGFRIIPVVYIKNKVMLLKSIDLDSLSANIISYIGSINLNNNIKNDEVQIDCDWTLESRDNFMKFMEIFKKISKKKLSVTIRLHQVKYYRKTKVPLADYGVLMYYNMGKISADSLNSVYDRDIAKRYLKSLKTYPLNLDVALPIFSQGIQIEKKKVKNLISKINIEAFQKDTNFIQLSENRLVAKNPNFKSGFYFKQNDEIKIETINFNHLKEMAEDLSDKLARKPKHIIFFDLDSANFNSYKNENQIFSKISGYF